MIERQLNILIFLNIVLLLVCDVLFTGLDDWWIRKHALYYEYIWEKSSVVKVGTVYYAAQDAKNRIASYYLLFNQFIPLTLVVLLEMGKLHFTQNIENDSDMVIEDHFIKDSRGCSV